MTYNNTPVVSKIKLGDTSYYVKDAEARVAIGSIESAIAGGTHFIGQTSTAALADGYTGGVTIGSTEYVPGTPSEGQVQLSAGDIVIKAAASGASEAALEYIWDGSKWSELGSTGHLKALAYVDQTTASYTPAGSVTVSNGSVLSSVKTAGTLPTKAADSFTANTPTTIDVTKFSGGSKAADSFTAATYSHTGFSGGSLGNATTSAFATEGVTAAMDTTDTEMLVISSASTSNAVTALGTFTPASYGTDSFSGGSFTEGTFTPASLGTGFYSVGTAASFTEGAFTQGAMPTFDTATVTASFSGTAATIVADAKTAA